MAEQQERYEDSRFSVRVATAALCVLSLVVIVVGAALWLLKQEFESAVTAPPAETPVLEESVDAARLQRDPARDLAQLRARHQQILTSTAWVDREAGTARIPIERAMDMLVQEGWPEGAP